MVSSSKSKERTILITGAAGQIGIELIIQLRKRYGNKNVIGIGRTTPPLAVLNQQCPGPFYLGVDVRKMNDLEGILKKHKDIDTIYHLAAILSGEGEKNPLQCWDVNMNGTLTVLEFAKKNGISRVFIPSSIGAFGSDAPRQAPQDCAMHPSTMYGVTKVAGELLGDYYAKKYGMRVRGVRLPGVISSEAMPGGGTTDYAVEIFYEALKNGKYECYIDADTAMPMVYMPDAIKAMIDLCEFEETENKKLTHYCDFNVTAFSFTPRQLAQKIQLFIPDFQITYKPDFRQKIAESWPDNMLDTVARQEWEWKPSFTFEAMVQDMIEKLRDRKKKQEVIILNRKGQKKNHKHQNYDSSFFDPFVIGFYFFASFFLVSYKVKLYFFTMRIQAQQLLFRQTTFHFNISLVQHYIHESQRD
ncbi:NAD-dependent epimerase/dehydratase [Reticulomyxa filosa]|uniref:NAD-dependent epimerase/dehydratase n=1 Tax=Reticulomyxa filosa TaxID=46433 RepID=X6MJA9_RETFI|nr:NAD-dependent epimerase/dehydratase [Reticulomyxa filosa]|eukprot:ETO13522.1 NAD-dependent epimerase/dehydratase [Reticulomyxa filosa]